MTTRMDRPGQSAEAPTDAEFVAQSLIAWQLKHGRHDLPWQLDRTPYRVWISEAMLQQTQVATVVAYYQRFLQRFPDVHSLATAPIDDVLHLWSGLGYYSRARNLQRAAQSVLTHHDGRLPRDQSQLMALPGIGRSTAAAILALAFGERATILDGNVKRVLARFFAIEGLPNLRATEQQLWQRAEQCTPASDVDTYTQAMMDLGATLCTRHRPACERCPLGARCRALATDRVADLPTRHMRDRAARRLRTVTLLLVSRPDGAVLLRRRPAHGIWGGLWSPLEFDTAAAARDFCDTQRPAIRLDPAPLPTLRHGFTHFDLDIVPWRARTDTAAAPGFVMEAPGTLWYNPATPARIGLPAPVSALLTNLSNP